MTLYREEDGWTVIPFSQGWTVRVQRDGQYLYFEWLRTGSQDPYLSDCSPEEARAFAEVLTKLAI